MGITSMELARVCGISRGTVDRALKGRPGVNKATRERVLAAALHLPHCARRKRRSGSLSKRPLPDGRRFSSGTGEGALGVPSGPGPPGSGV